MLTDGVNDLMDHHFTELKLFVAFLATADVLRDHCAAIHLAVRGRASICLAVTALLVILRVECRDGSSFADAPVTHGAGTIVLPSQVEGLEEKQDRNHGQCEQHQDNLDGTLTAVQLLFDSARRQEHIDEHVQQSRRLLSNSVPVNAPLVDNGENQIPEDGLEENHAREEVAENVNRSLEVAGVDVRQAQGVGHLLS